MTDKRHGDPEHGGLSSGEKAAITRQVKAGEEVHLKSHPEHQAAAKQYAKEVASREGIEQGHAQAGAGHGGHHLSGGEKAVVTRTVHAGGKIEDIPFVQGHPRKLQQAQEYAEEVRGKEGQE